MAARTLIPKLWLMELCKIHPYALVPEDDVILELDKVLFWKRMLKACRYLNVCHAGWVASAIGAG